MKKRKLCEVDPPVYCGFEIVESFLWISYRKVAFLLYTFVEYRTTKLVCLPWIQVSDDNLILLYKKRKSKLKEILVQK